ncbi:filamin-binding LIM protein 1 [Microcaecilia unicolor]|uniref:Filamin-binding LIM protein 1 n=1 Tax=Microcaecilia unicolor TaxID=1415580 RepID=A0A6P7WN56_9AMPH|nr:filamin-binding LIM protein 1 [Microcaecilia unicolor]
MSEKRMVSSVYITLVPPWRGVPDARKEKLEEAETRGDEPCQSPRSEQAEKGFDENHSPESHEVNRFAESGPEYSDFSSEEIVSFPHPVLDDFSPVEDFLSPDLPPPPPPIPEPLPRLILADFSPPISGEPVNPGLKKLDPSPPPNLQQVSSAFSVESKPQTTEPISFKQAERSQALNMAQNEQVESLAGICAFCHKAIAFHVSAVEAMRKQYHADCFTCRTCNRQLAGQLYYQKDGRPICDPCYKATLEKCARCQAVIFEKIVRAMGSGYHLGCFTCAVCHRRIADESFAVDDQNEVYCVDDYYRKYASMCDVCHDPIIPVDGKDLYKIECLGRSFHENCYRCEKCKIPLSVEPTEKGCYPLDNHLLCKPCHLAWNVESSC